MKPSKTGWNRCASGEDRVPAEFLIYAMFMSLLIGNVIRIFKAENPEKV